MARASLSNQRTTSLGRARLVRAPAAVAKTPAPDKRTRTPGQGGRGTTRCPSCDAEVSLKGAVFSDHDAGIRLGDSVLSPHRVGGGRYSVMRGDARCPGSDQLPVITAAGEGGSV